jgi:hypothetical protein
MAVIGAGAAELGFSALYDLLKSALSRLRRRRGWERGLADYCRQQGVSLSDAEIARLIEWIRAGDIDALATDAGGDLVTALDREVMRTSDPALAAQQASPSQWAAENRHRAEQLGAAIWGAVDAVLERDERVGLRAAVAAVHSSEVADSLMAELGWLRDEVERLPRLVRCRQVQPDGAQRGRHHQRVEHHQQRRRPGQGEHPSLGRRPGHAVGSHRPKSLLVVEVPSLLMPTPPATKTERPMRLGDDRCRLLVMVPIPTHTSDTGARP